MRAANDVLIWIVEDSAPQREAIARELAPHFGVETFDGGSHVIERLGITTRLPDAVVVDWEMPGISGREVCEFVRGRFDSTALPLLVLGASHDRQTALACFAAGANDHVTKPFDTAELVARLSGLARIKTMHDELRREAEFRERFMGVLGHDLRQPLNTFVVGADLLLHHSDLAPAQAQTVQRLKKAAARMKRMVADLLDLTSSRSGGLRIAPSPTDLARICQDIVDDVRPSVPSRLFRFASSGDTSGTWDSDRLAQVCTNLIGNAVDHGEAGTPIDVSVRGELDDVVLCIENRGEIAPETIASIFEPFQRGGSSTGGLGLGLFIVEQIVRAHGGTVTATSRDGTTSFEVRLIRASEEARLAFVPEPRSSRGSSPPPRR